MKKKTISIIIENLLYGGTTSHLINFINSIEYFNSEKMSNEFLKNFRLIK